MISPSDSFSASFDAIALDAATAPSAAAIDAALSACATPNEPGFYLLDDSAGRFTIDRDFGVVSLQSDAVLDAERDAVHVARLLVIEHSGERYELTLKLKLTGMVPQAVMADESEVRSERRLRTQSWPHFAACDNHALDDAFLDERAPFGALLAWSCTECIDQPTTLVLAAAPPRPAARDAVWPL